MSCLPKLAIFANRKHYFSSLNKMGRERKTANFCENTTIFAHAAICDQKALISKGGRSTPGSPLRGLRFATRSGLPPVQLYPQPKRPFRSGDLWVMLRILFSDHNGSQSRGVVRFVENKEIKWARKRITLPACRFGTSPFPTAFRDPRRRSILKP